MPTENDLHQWANLIIETDANPRFRSIYINTQTHSLIYEDESKDPWASVLLDADGKQIEVDKAQK